MCEVVQSCPTLCDPCMVHGILQARMLEWVAISFPNPGIEPRSPTLQVDSLPAEPQGKSKNTGVSSLSLLQGIFPPQGFPHGSEDKASSCKAGDPGLIPGLGRSRGEGNGNPLQYSCLENPMDGGAWQATVHGVTKNWT